MVIGISGKAAAGKNAVADYFDSKGFLILDADMLGIEALTVCRTEIHRTFGDQVLDEEGNISRKKLGALVFHNKKELKKLNAISHPYILKRIDEGIHQSINKNIVINAALLPYWHVKELTAVIWVEASIIARFVRALKRDRRGIVFTLRRILAQRRLSPKLFPKTVDVYKVYNRYDILELENQLNVILRKLLEKDKVNLDAK
jgi:dephospho-CoA kinase